MDIDYEILPAVVRPEDALRERAALVGDQAGSNLCFQIEAGERATVDAAFASAAFISRLEMHYPRASANPIEPRASFPGQIYSPRGYAGRQHADSPSSATPI